MSHVAYLTKTVIIQDVAVDQNDTIDLPDGTYLLAIHTNQNLAVGTAIITATAFVDEAQTKVSSDRLQFYPFDASTTAIALTVVIGSDTGQSERIVANAAGAGAPFVSIPFGFRVEYDATGAMTGSMSYTIVATRIDP